MPEHTSVATDPSLTRKLRRYSLILLVVALVLGAWGIVSRLTARSALASETLRDSTITVATVKPAAAETGEDLVLPGTVQAFIEAPIYARTSGYLKSWSTDIGAVVKRGQLMAELDTPEVDQQLLQAQADLATARANEVLAASTNKRWQELLATESVSRQDADTKSGDSAAKKAAADSAAANVQRLRELESFKRIVAPFDGVVTARNTDIGALINAGQASGNELFRIADTNKLRIYVRVPEAYAASAKPGVEAELKVSGHSKSYTAKIVRTSSALDTSLRTLQVELQLDNDQHEVLPGAYTEVHFKLGVSGQSLRLPANTVLFRSAGLQVAVVDAQNHVKLKSVIQGRDFGNTIEILSGVEPTDAVVINPPDSLSDGATVRIAPPKNDGTSDKGKAT